MVIIESTIAPGTMEHVVKPILEETSGLRVNEDFYLVNCPERVMPGKLLTNIRGCHRVVGGMSPQAAELAVRLYQHMVQADLDPVDCLTAELVKTMENTYRDVQIAFANEMALLCESLDADVWRVRELVNKAPYRDMHLPGAGVGGHCLPKDPWLLISNAGNGFDSRLIPSARATNEGMPQHVADLVVDALREAGRDIAGAKVAVLGYAYLQNSDDTRNSPSAVLVERVRRLGAEVSIHDPYVVGCERDLSSVLQGADVAVIAVAHDAYWSLDWAALKSQFRTPVVVDGRNVCEGRVLERTGYRYRMVGRGRRAAQ